MTGVRQLAAALDCGGLPPRVSARASSRNPGLRQAAALRAGYSPLIIAKNASLDTGRPRNRSTSSRAGS